MSHFDAFWQAYPRKCKKKESREVWNRMKLDRLAETIIESVQLFKTSHKPWLDGYIPHPTTFLRGERWEDELEENNGRLSATNQTEKQASILRVINSCARKHNSN